MLNSVNCDNCGDYVEPYIRGEFNYNNIDFCSSSCRTEYIQRVEIAIPKDILNVPNQNYLDQIAETILDEIR